MAVFSEAAKLFLSGKRGTGLDALFGEREDVIEGVAGIVVDLELERDERAKSGLKACAGFGVLGGRVDCCANAGGWGRRGVEWILDAWDCGWGRGDRVIVIFGNGGREAVVWKVFGTDGTGTRRTNGIWGSWKLGRGMNPG